MATLKPEIAILDETDSGLDIDALRIVASTLGLDGRVVEWGWSVLVDEEEQATDWVRKYEETFPSA